MKFFAKINLLRLAQLFFGAGVFILPLRIRSLIFADGAYSLGFFDEYRAFFIHASELFFLVAFALLGLAFIFRGVKMRKIPVKFLLPFLILLAVKIAVVPFSRDPILSLLHFWRTFEFAVGAFFVASGVFELRAVVRILAAAFFLQSALAVAQFFARGELGLHFFGESFFTAETFNVGKTVLPSGDVLVRGMGTLPHANIFAGLAAVVLLLLAARERKYSLVYFVAVVIFAGMFFAFSRAADLAFFAGLLVLLVFNFRRRIFSTAAALGMFSFLIFFFGAPFFVRIQNSPASSIDRFSQISQSVAIARENIFGVGRGEYTAALAEQFSALDFWQIQPVHNFFALKTAEESIFTAFAWVAIFAVFALWGFREKKFEVLALVVGLFLLANFDHYFSSNFTGEAVLWIAFAFVVAEISARPDFEKSAVKSSK